MYKLGVIASHPIQYQAPIFRELQSRVDLFVYFAHRDTPQDQASEGFGVEFQWDRDLTGGYNNKFLKNRSARPSFSKFFGCSTPEVFRVIRENHFDAVLVMGWNLFSFWQAIFACKFNKTPVFVRGDSTLCTTRSDIRKLVKWLPYRLFFYLFDRCLYVGKLNKEYYRHYGVDESKLIFSPHSVDNRWFQSRLVGVEKRRIRQQLGIEQDTIIFLYVGKLLKGKRPADIIDAVEGIRKKCAIAYVGSGNEVPELKKRSLEKGVKSYFLGFKNQTEMPECYHMSDLCILPSESETWGLTVNEAMACGIPVVVSDAVGCAADLVEEGVTGYTYPVGDVETLRKILVVFIDSEFRQNCSSSVLNKIDEYSPANTSVGILKACESVCVEHSNIKGRK